ncbi:unnamed protein product [Arctogadus glacialis]
MIPHAAGQHCSGAAVQWGSSAVGQQCSGAALQWGSSVAGQKQRLRCWWNPRWSGTGRSGAEGVWPVSLPLMVLFVSVMFLVHPHLHLINI